MLDLGFIIITKTKPYTCRWACGCIFGDFGSCFGKRITTRGLGNPKNATTKGLQTRTSCYQHWESDV